MRKFTIAGLFVALIIAGALSPYASQSPDGLDKVAETHGFKESESPEPMWRFAPMPEYAAPGVENKSTATRIAGVTGALVVFGLGIGLSKIVWRRNG